jgi:glycosyltransferase involved in cell wall biosynthesis
MPNKIKVALIRGSFLNPNELANYAPLLESYDLSSFSSQNPLGANLKIPNQKLYSPFDSFANMPEPWKRWGERITKIVANRTWGDPHRLFGLEKALCDYQILDVADPYYYFSYQAAKMRRANPNIRLVVTYCETIAHNNETTFPKRRIKQFVLKTADLVVCHSQLSKEAVLSEGVKRNRVRVIPLGVNLKEFYPVLRRPENILYVGRLVPEKGVLYLFEAFKNLSLSFPKLKLSLVGNGPLAKHLRQEALKAKLSNRVTIKSHSYKEIAQCYRKNTYFVLPSYRTTTWEEQYGMALVEAMASGMVIVGTQSGAIPEVLGKVGVIIPPKNSFSLEKMLEKLITNSKLRRSLGKAARRRAKSHYSHTLFADRIEAVYEELNCRNPRP